MKGLLKNLRKKVPDSLFSLNRDLFIFIMCKETIREMKLDYIGHKLEPQLLLKLNIEEDIDEEKERINWEKIKKVAWYVNKSDPARIVAFNAKDELTRN